MRISALLTGLLLVSVAVFNSCSKGSGNSTPATPDLTVTVSKTSLRADNFDEVKITVKNKSGVDITTNASISANGTIVRNGLFYTSDPGIYSIKASYGSATSDPVTVTATSAGASPFTQKLLVEDFTGAWCGHCPRVGIQLENYRASGHPNCIVVGVHNADPMQFSYESQLRSSFGISAFPSVLINRDFIWDENESALNNQLSKRAPLGIALNTTINGSTVDVTAKVKFDVSTNYDLKLVIALVEDGIVYSQTNYGYYSLPNPITNYIHNGVLRKIGTDLYGDAIDKTAQVSGGVFQKTVSMNTTGYNQANLRVVAYVLFGGFTRKGALNVQSVAAGQNKDFD